MIIPPINTEGKFIFKEPFLSKYKSDVVYKVVGVRTIEEMYEAQEDPFEYVYKFFFTIINTEVTFFYCNFDTFNCLKQEVFHISVIYLIYE